MNVCDCGVPISCVHNANPKRRGSELKSLCDAKVDISQTSQKETLSCSACSLMVSSFHMASIEAFRPVSLLKESYKHV